MKLTDFFYNFTVIKIGKNPSNAGHYKVGTLKVKECLLVADLTNS